MERRAFSRVQVSIPVVLTSLEDASDPLAAQIVDLSGSGARLRIPAPLPVNSLVRLDFPDNLLLGEVVYCSPDGVAWACGIQLEHSLTRIADLHSLFLALRQEAESKPLRTTA